jgi:hypothetical protein
MLKPVGLIGATEAWERGDESGHQRAARSAFDDNPTLPDGVPSIEGSTRMRQPANKEGRTPGEARAAGDVSLPEGGVQLS